jgi:hypothetical protein
VCRERVATELSSQLQQAEELVAGGKSADAIAAVRKIDARYGGLGSPHSIELAEKAGAE